MIANGPTSSPESATGPMARAVLARWAGLFGFWLLLADPGPAPLADLVSGLAVGVLSAAAATWASLRLLPPGPGRVRIGALLRVAARFVWQSAAGGADVAYRVFHPRMPLKPGYLAYPVRLPRGPAQAVFGALTSLVPGTLPLGSDAHGRLLYHCLDTDLPVAAALAADEALMARALGLADADPVDPV